MSERASRDSGRYAHGHGMFASVCSRRYVRVNVERTTLCFSAVLDQGISSLDTKVSHSLRASSKPIALWWCRAEIIEEFW